MDTMSDLDEAIRVLHRVLLERDGAYNDLGAEHHAMLLAAYHDLIAVRNYAAYIYANGLVPANG